MINSNAILPLISNLAVQPGNTLRRETPVSAFLRILRTC